MSCNNHVFALPKSLPACEKQPIIRTNKGETTNACDVGFAVLKAWCRQAEIETCFQPARRYSSAVVRHGTWGSGTAGAHQGERSGISSARAEQGRLLLRWRSMGCGWRQEVHGWTNVCPIRAPREGNASVSHRDGPRHGSNRVELSRHSRWSS